MALVNDSTLRIILFTQKEFSTKADLLSTIDAYARAKDPRVKQVSVSLAASWQKVDILRADGWRISDTRPMVRFSVAIVASDGTMQEQGSYTAAAGVHYMTNGSQKKMANLQFMKLCAKHLFFLKPNSAGW